MDLKIRSFACFSVFKGVLAEGKDQVYCNSYTSQTCMQQAPGIQLLVGGSSAHLGQGDLEVKLEKKETAYEHQICYAFDTMFISLF